MDSSNPTVLQSCPFWHYDDVPECGRVKYIGYDIPFLIIVFGIVFIAYNIISNYYNYDYLHLKKENLIDQLLYDTTASEEETETENQPLLSNARNAATQYNGVEVPKEEELSERHFSIEKIKLLKPDGSIHGTPNVIHRSFTEKSRILSEFIIVVIQLYLHGLILFKYSNKGISDFNHKNSFINALLWSILTIIIVLRIWNINQNSKWVNKYPGNLWSISFVAYLFAFTSTLLPFRSILIHNIKNNMVKNYYLSQFCLNFVLFFLLFTAQVGNKLPVIYKTDDWIDPSPEPTSSICSFISWSWLDSFVWVAHQNTLVFKDIWALRIDDYSIFVVKKFKTFITRPFSQNNFSSNLFLFFMKYFLLQGFWACLSAPISFVPTVLLKRILEYVDDQSSAPKNLAWFYVSCMFACGVLGAIFRGQALFYGRRVCVRMRSIIISEIYSKALRRKASTMTNKNDDDDEKDQETNTEDLQDITTALPESPVTAEEIDALNETTDASKKETDNSPASSANLGAIINLMAVDAFKVSEICGYLHFFVEALLMVVVALALLYHLLGYAALVGGALVVAFLPLNLKLATLLGEYQKKSLAVTDKRIQKLNETFQAIRIIKYFSWEDNFTRDIETVREKELHLLFKRSLIWAFSSFIWFITPSIVTSCSFAFYIYVQGETLTTPVAFTALSLFTLLKTPLDQLSNMISFVIQSKVSLDRIQDLLQEKETEKYSQLTIDKNGNRIAFQNATVAWDKKNSEFKLRDLNIDFKPGKLNVVIGPTGSGKSSLLLALLGEMHLENGNIIVPSLDPRDELVIDHDGMTNSIAYCSQGAWLLNDTVRNNILFNSPYNEARYNAVVEACCLKRDFEILKAGDMTEIGEKGITLSGGQKQRVSLARALYSNSRHVLLDDCLSAVDSHTALWIYDNCITGPLMENRTCILVSHNIALTLRNAELVVILEDGRVKDQGDPVTILQKGLLGDDELVKSSILSRTNSSVNLSSNSAINLAEADKVTAKKEDGDNTANLAAGRLIEEETKANGVVSIRVYQWYLNIFGGWKTISFLSTIFVATQLVFISQSWWVRHWVSTSIHEVYTFVKQRIHASLTTNIGSVMNMRYNHGPLMISTQDKQAVTNTSHSTFYYLSIYFGIGALQSSLAAIRNIINFTTGLNASRKIFKSLLHTVLHSKLRFFDATPIGRIMNRFSKDIEAVDQELTPYLEAAFYCLVECVSTMLLIAFITPQFLILAIFIGFLYYLVGYFYMAASRELKRFESVTKSPIYQHFSETLVGIVTIRAYGDEKRFMLENLHKIDENNKPFFYLWAFNRWLSFRIDMIGSLVVFGAGVFIILNIDNLDSGLAGISLTYAISFTEAALWLVRFYADVEMNMNSVERLKEYMEIDQEPYEEHLERSEVLAVDNWPRNGKIEVNNLSLRYAPNLPKVIKNVTFVVEPNCKVGVVGRTGAGKSTIITALFRFLDAETGYIKIDDIDITTVNLTKLRRSITIIPQDPTLFSGTIRSNLDPYNEFSDDAIFKALRRVNLINENESTGPASSETSPSSTENVNKFLNLKNEITEGGNNLSHGQRQLVCLARSLLRCPKIILLDEATASIDNASDAKIQETIRKEFKESTILTIAHRLRSVCDYDKILVMDAGEVKEYDHPYSLLLNKNSIFYSMCEQSGELDALIDMAKGSFVEKLNSK
ncbi:putative ATP-binding cassette multidrug transporter VMR1 NDAI_0H00190 [Naumovozyma dairenensis CBS 421]|uniref:Uncharacterized protein n=1 Tax=Naumovozyma dairenensis (strain ATCC 10597 / BCRC 20456 / CBS 421 / NBRC 0211 / NRRL Y-12639) TaxID=1071378 RepID=G0WEI2_NAUDC|nr:hypothetical protein NDAI_0H00190 [Naumovozyma dairenensis CBS 421]CCD26193.1 hypothetical protein NDAI_0H00190 [Naumovozyma dairenensis CBS 421]